MSSNLNSNYHQEPRHQHRTLIVSLVVALLFIALNSFFLTKDWYYISFIPLAALVVFLFVIRLDNMLALIALLTPFSVNVRLMPQMGMEMSLPVEPMMLLFCAIFIFRMLLSRNYDKRLLRHPISIAVFVFLAWMFITSCLSELPMVSFKHLAAQLWFIIPFYFGAIYVYQVPQRMYQVFWGYAIGLVTIIIIATTRTLSNFSDLQTMHHVMSPFYNDHTAYGCAIALLLPASLYMTLRKDQTPWMRLTATAVFVLLIVGLILSYCRAAWLSIAGAIALFVLLRMGIKVKHLLLISVVGVSLFFAYQGDILYKMGKNHQDSSYDMGDQVKSMTNIATDASNLERLNRWASAFRLWQENPIWGSGPGTYQFQYASYQRSYQLSTISTNAGDLGNAHSEYIGPLSEQGVPGVLTIAGIFVVTFVCGVRVYKTARNRQTRLMALAFTLSLTTYYIHGFFNNFLDTDKLSIPFWAFTAVIAALDLYCEKEDDQHIPVEQHSNS